MNKSNCNPVDGCGYPNLYFRPFLYPNGVGEPINTVAPVVSGTPTVGQNLSVTNGTWTGAVSYTYKWTRNGVVIAGATANTYALVGADQTRTIGAIVTAVNAVGNSSMPSNTVGPIA